MPKRCSSNDSNNESVRKKSVTCGPTVDLRQGEILTDTTGKRWKLGKTIGVGGFGKIYLVSDALNADVTTDSAFVAKVESHANGPLFVEMNCYLRIAKADMIDNWKLQNNVEDLGMPHYVASGSHNYNHSKYRFLIIPRYENDLESVLQLKRKFNIKTVLAISSQIIDTLRYIHDKGYVHSDIKASNILLGKKASKQKQQFAYRTFKYREIPTRTCKPRKIQKIIPKNLRPMRNFFYLDDIPDFDLITDNRVEISKVNKEKSENNQVYLLDYGLATRYLTSDKKHKEFCCDERKAHAGTILFCSRDAHDGVQSRRSDLECLGYNMIYWLTGSLPWIADVDNPELVKKKKRKCIENLPEFLHICFSEYPKFLYDYFAYLKNLKFKDKPDYTHCKRLFKNAFKEYGYTDNNKFDFENLEGWGGKAPKLKKKSENRRRPIVHQINRMPLQSNSPIVRPKLREKTKKFNPQMNWSKILIDPEVILKQQRKTRERKVTESSDCSLGVESLEIWEMNPTYAMVDVFTRWKERQFNGSPVYKTDSCVENVDGYTPAMMCVYNRMAERKQMESFKEEKVRRTRGRPAKRFTKTKKAFPYVKKEPYMFRKNKQRKKGG